MQKKSNKGVAMALIIIGIYIGLAASEIYKSRTTKPTEPMHKPSEPTQRAPRVETSPIMSQLIQPNGHDNVGFAPGANRDCFWVMGMERNGEFSAFYVNAVTSVSHSVPIVHCDKVISISSYANGTKARLIWVSMDVKKMVTELQVDTQGVPFVMSTTSFDLAASPR